MAHPWNFHLGYAFPLFQLIPLVLRKIQKESVSVILINLFWPKRAWFSTILQMAVKPLWQLTLTGFTTAGSSVLPRCSQAKPHRLVSEEQLLRNKGLSEPLVTFFLLESKVVIRTIYTKVWKVYNFIFFLVSFGK